MITETEVQTIVYEAISKTFGVAVRDIGVKTTASDVDGWDSVSSSHLFFAIEDRVNVELPIEKLLASENVGEMAKQIWIFLCSQAEKKGA
jgi:acyl carrier protein